MISLFKLKEKQVAPRQIIKLVKHAKASYDSAEAAQSAALEIKKGYATVKVSIFDSIESTSRLIELPS